MALQWYHHKWADSDFSGRMSQRYTACVDVPEFKAIRHLAQFLTGNTLKVNIGITKVHPKEQYVKAIGREESKKRLSEVELTLLKADYHDEYVGITLFSMIHRMQMYLKVCKKNGSVRLVSVYFVD